MRRPILKCWLARTSHQLRREVGESKHLRGPRTGAPRRRTCGASRSAQGEGREDAPLSHAAAGGGEKFGLALLALLLLGLTATPAQAQLLWGRSSTYARGFVQPADSDTATYLPFYELVELHTGSLGLQGLSVHTQVWGMVDALDLQQDGRFTGDVNTLYLTYRAPQQGKLSFLRGLELTGGRQFVALGPGVLEQLDGGKAHYIHSTGLELGVFGGRPTGARLTLMPWPTDDDDYEHGYNWVVGGRLGYVDLGWLSGGATYVHRRYDGLIADNDLGADVSYSPLSWLDLSGEGTFSLEAQRLKQVRGSVALRPFASWAFNLGYRYSSPDLWLPRSSIFAVFSEESFHEAHADARWQATRRLTVDATYGRRFYGVHDHSSGDDHAAAPGANRVALRASYRPSMFDGGRLLAELGRLESPDNAANRVRLAAVIPLHLLKRTIRVVADVDLMLLDEPIRDSQLSLLASAYVELPILRSLQLLAGGSGGVSPLLSSVGTFTVRLNWDFELERSAKGKPAKPLVQVQRGRLM